MYFQPEISKWGIFCPSKEKQICETFLNTLKQCVETYKYPMKQPKIFYIDGIKFEDWSSELRKLDTTVQALIFLLPGMKKNGKFYTEIKEILLKDIPIPSQVVLLKTIQAQKGLRSICNKILVQICAKIGGVPWTINHMPFNDKPTMIVGYDIFKRGDNNFISFCATTDRYFSKYWSSVKIIPFVQNSCANLSEMTNSAIQEFQSTNKIKPVNVIVYRDGISRSERTQIKNLEVDAIRKGFKNEKINLIFICVNKKTNNKYYLLDNSQNLSNPLPGTVIETTFSDTNDFMLISQKVNQGTVVPSHFHMIENDLKEIDRNSIEKIKVLSYKLCYLYYNWVGSIKIPAPLMYAQKLSSLIGEKFGKIVPHKNYGEKKCLYFI